MHKYFVLFFQNICLTLVNVDLVFYCYLLKCWDVNTETNGQLYFCVFSSNEPAGPAVPDDAAVVAEPVDTAPFPGPHDAALLGGPDDLVVPAEPSVDDPQHADNQEKRSFITYGTTVYAVPSERVTQDMDMEAYLAGYRATPLWSVSALTQNVSSGRLYLLSSAHSVLTMSWSRDAIWDDDTKKWMAPDALWREFTDMTFFVRFNDNGRNRSVRVSAKAFGYLGDFTHAGVGQYSGQCQPSVYVDVLAIEVDDVTSLRQYCDCSRIGGKAIDSLVAADIDIPCDNVCKQSRNYDDVQEGQRVDDVGDRFYTQDLPGASQANTMRVKEMAHKPGCSGSAIYSLKPTVDGLAAVTLHGLTFKHVPGPHNLMAVHIKPCLEALEREFSGLRLRPIALPPSADVSQPGSQVAEADVSLPQRH